MPDSDENNGTVMVVEDNDFVRMQTAAYLTDSGKNVVECATALDAIDKANDDIDVVIADMRMESMDGFEFLKSLKAKDFNAPVILTIGDDAGDLLGESSRLGVFAVLKKPVDRDRLIVTVDRALQSKSRVGAS